MKTLIIITVFVTAFASLYAQLGNYDKLPEQKAKYYQDFLTFLGEDGKTRLDVFVQVPYKEIQFVKTGEGFEAAYTITVSVLDEQKDKIITEKIWSEKIVALSFDVTTSADNFNLSHRSFDLPPGNYFIRTSIMDKDSRKEFTAENNYAIRNLESLPSISDIMIISSDKTVEGNRKLVPNISRNVTIESTGLPMFFEAYTDSVMEAEFDYIITDKENSEVYRTSDRKALNEGSNQVFYSIDSLLLNLGSFMVTVRLSDENQNVLSTARKSFTSRWKGVPKSISDLDKAIDQMIYIANTDELNKIKNAETNVEKTKNFVEFWKKKDPNPKDEYNPAFEEYYRRVNFANENFSNYSEGWRSDRGMVLIILGAPNNIDRYPFEYDSKPYEVWQYYDLNKRFVFVDNTGFGDYRLITPLYGDLYRYRY
jgi:GWxTD domain-containing protein